MTGPAIREMIAAISVSSRATIREAMQAIDRGRLKLALLVEPKTGRFQGLVTDGDLRRALLSGLGLSSSLQDVPDNNPTVAREGASAEELTSLLSQKVRVVPILDDEDRVVDLAILEQRAYLPVAQPSLGEEEFLNVGECVLSGWVSSTGKFVRQFEEAMAAYCDTRHAVATCNGTAALHLALAALDIGPGDEVIVPSLTFIAPANAVTYVGATPVFVDSDRATWTIDPAAIEAAITPRTKAIIPVHLYGHPADMDRVQSIADRHGLSVVEDAAEAHGATYKGKRVGGIGDVGIFSFFGNKIITTGEGGMLVTNDDDIAQKARLLGSHGMSPERRYWHTVLGFNYRMTNLQAAVGVGQMAKIDALVAARRKTAALYTEALSDIPGIVLPPESDWCTNVYWLYSILVDPNIYGMDRDGLENLLRVNQIDSRRVFPPVHTQPIYQSGQSLPVCDTLSAQGLSLPSGQDLSQTDIARTADIIRGATRDWAKKRESYG